MPRKNFIRQIEDFTCEHCRKKVKGSGYTNHCPSCLWSKHIDNVPGDRNNPCNGSMEPVGIEAQRDKQQLVHRCQKCGIIKKNKVAADDDREAILGLVEGK